MSRVTGLSDSPIRLARKQLHLSIEQLGAQSNIHYQAIYLNEVGCYPGILPRLLSFLGIKGFEEKQLVREYHIYQRAQRNKIGECYNFRSLMLPKSNLERSPIESLWEILEFSKMGFAKALCVQPALISELVKGKYKNMPTQLEGALRDCGLPEHLIEELNERTEEFYYANKARRPRLHKMV